MTSQTTESFPILILQNSIKITIETNKGIQANLQKALHNISSESFDE